MCSLLCVLCCMFFFFKQKTAYEMRISDWSSDVCSSDLSGGREWAGWSTGQLRNARGLHGISLDSAGFSAMVAYGGYPWTVDDYLDLAATYPDRKSVV